MVEWIRELLRPLGCLKSSDSHIAAGDHSMRLVQMFGLALFFVSVSLLWAGGVGIPKKEDVPKYMKQLTSPTAADRAKAAEMLGKRGGINANDVEGAVDPLRKLLEKDSDARVRSAAARALGEIHGEPEETVPVLIERLKKDDKKDVKMAIVVALGQYGPDAKDALPPLREMMAKFDTKAAKKSADAQTIQTSIQLITMVKKKKG
jgi:HEAT repeats